MQLTVYFKLVLEEQSKKVEMDERRGQQYNQKTFKYIRTTMNKKISGASSLYW